MIVDTENNYIYLAETPNSHLLIMGQSGSGKTYYCNRKIEQEIQKGKGVLIFTSSLNLKSPKRSLLRSTNVRSGLQFTALKFFSMSSFLLATEVVEKSYLTTRYWLCSFVGCSPIQVPPNKSLNCVAMLRS